MTVTQGSIAWMGLRVLAGSLRHSFMQAYPGQQLARSATACEVGPRHDEMRRVPQYKAQFISCPVINLDSK